MKLRTLRMQRMKRKNRSNLGPRCRTFYPGCIVCACYRYLDKYGRFPYTFAEAAAYNFTLEETYAHP